jgi:hypothetical protein
MTSPQLAAFYLLASSNHGTSHHLATYLPTHLLTHSLTHPLTYSPTHPLTYSPTHLLTYSPTHSPTKKAERARGSFCRAGWASFACDNTWEGHPGTRLEPPTSIRQSRLPRSSLDSDAQSSLSRFAPSSVQLADCCRALDRAQASSPAHSARTAKQLAKPVFACVAASREACVLGRGFRMRPSRPMTGVPLQTPQVLIRESRFNSTPLCAVRVSCQAENLVTIFCGRAHCESLPTLRVARIIPARFARGKAAHRAP